VAEEAPGVLGVTNDGPTYFTYLGTSCVAPPGLKIVTGAVPNASSRQWLGNAAVSANCTTFSYPPLAVMRAVHGPDGKEGVAMAWPQTSAGSRPSIGPDGEVSSGSAYFTTGVMKRTTPAAARRLGRTLPPGRLTRAVAAGPVTDNLGDDVAERRER
jgi:hypothetical protein